MSFKHWFLFFLVTATFSACKDEKTPVQGPPPAVQVALETVTPTSAVYYDEYPGTVAALNEIQLTAQVTGYVTSINFKDGDKVRKGQLLYSLDAQVYSANYE